MSYRSTIECLDVHTHTDQTMVPGRPFVHQFNLNWQDILHTKEIKKVAIFADIFILSLTYITAIFSDILSSCIILYNGYFFFMTAMTCKNICFRSVVSHLDNHFAILAF